ncbi:MAG TPA: hypothetical protein VLX91_08770 [Candidatus Acidoferrales bacterium]|nr:hypothetical protein [Candidatus Acidoferrales bacterium]
MTRALKATVILLCLNLATAITSFSQGDNYEAITDSIAAKVKRITGHTCYISGTDIDRQIIEDHETALKDPYFEERIKDPYHTLAGCFIFLASDAENSDSSMPGFVGIYNIKLDSVLWRSVPLSSDFSSGALGSMDATGELNRDGKVEIIVGQATGNLGVNHQLWIFNWDGKDGKLITQLDSLGRSEIMYWGDEYEIKDVDGDGIYEILGEWYKNYDSDKMTTIMYSWNGSLYGKWGKSSRYSLKEKKK